MSRREIFVGNIREPYYCERKSLLDHLYARAHSARRSQVAIGNRRGGGRGEGGNVRRRSVHIWTISPRSIGQFFPVVASCVFNNERRRLLNFQEGEIKKKRKLGKQIRVSANVSRMLSLASHSPLFIRRASISLTHARYVNSLRKPLPRLRETRAETPGRSH